jgi:2,5-diketo-D-gluconate reductase A
MRSTSAILLASLAVSATADAGFNKTITLNNGLQMPAVSFGLQVVDDDTAKQQVQDALGVGVRNLFASVLANCQTGVGEGIKASGVARADLFVCGSVNNAGCGSEADCYTSTKQACSDNLQALGLDYVDMIMLDYPAYSCDGIKGQWRAFEEMYAANDTKSVAVSNFSPDQLDCIVGNASASVPTLNQMPYSLGHAGDSVVDDDKKRNVIVQAYSPLGGGGAAQDADCVAIGKKYSKSGAQVALKWILQHDAVFSTNLGFEKQFMQEDIALFDFTLSDADMATLDAKGAELSSTGKGWGKQ